MCPSEADTSGGFFSEHLMFAVRCIPPGNRKEYLRLLLLADPDETVLESYLSAGDMYLGLENEKIVCEAIILPLSSDTCELKNLATEPDSQRHGYARRLVDRLSHIYAERGFRTMLVGTSITGTSFYPKLGFCPSHIVENFFTDNYANPVLDNGILCIHMYYFQKILCRQE